MANLPTPREPARECDPTEAPSDAAQQQFLALAEAAIVVGRGRGGTAARRLPRPGDEAAKVGDETATVTVDATITEVHDHRRHDRDRLTGRGGARRRPSRRRRPPAPTDR